MDPVTRYERAKADLERLRSEQDRRAGSLEGLMKRLKAEYGLKTLEAAEKEVAKLQAKAESLQAEAEEKLDEVQGLL